MTDINTAPSRVGKAASAAETAGIERLTSVAELIFFAYRDFTGESDDVLKEYDFGRAHYRVLHFVMWRPGMRVADLLDILKITKQSLARVLKHLVDRGFIVQEAGEADRRERRLYPTVQGRKLAEELRTLQSRRIAAALAGLDANGKTAAMRFLLALTAPEDRGAIERSLADAGLKLSAGKNP
jgi:DNA-binding MarR family transcriptional regulator